MLISVEIDVCVVPNWSYVMICDRKFNLKTTCVKSNICDSFSIYISDVNFYPFVLFLLSFVDPSQLGWTGLLNVERNSEKLICTYSFFKKNLQCEIIETKNAHI